MMIICLQKYVKQEKTIKVHEQKAVQKDQDKITKTIDKSSQM